jgi:hypothetical protein
MVNSSAHGVAHIGQRPLKLDIVPPNLSHVRDV